MKKIISFLGAFVLSFALLFATSADASSFREVKVVNVSSLVVKEKATQSSASVAMLKKGEFVTVFSTTNGWAYIQSGTKKGYVNGSYLAIPKSGIKIASSKSGLVVKESPSKSAKTLATLKYSMIVEDFGSVGGGWSFVQYGNVTGYVASTFIGTPKTTTKTTKEAVNLRNIASPSGAVKTTLPAGTKVTIHSTIAGWSYVSSGEKRGYVEASKLVSAATIAYAKDYLPACPKTYTYVLTSNSDGYEETGSETYKCILNGSSRELRHINDLDGNMIGKYYSLEGSEMHVSYHEAYATYKFPLQVGKTWKDKAYGSYTTKYVMGINEVVTTPAGTFSNVIKIRSTNSSYGDVTYEYLAPNVGIVKTEYSSSYEGSYYSYSEKLHSMY